MKLTKIQSLEYTPHFEVPAAPERMPIKAVMSDKMYDMYYKFCAINPDLPCMTNKIFLGNVRKCFEAQMKLDNYNGKNPLDDAEAINNLREKIAAKKEAKKIYNKEHKEEKKAEADAKKAAAVCMLNGNVEPVGSWTLEPSGWFFGRGNCPVNGMWKKPNTLSDLTINWISSKPAPKGAWTVKSDPACHSIATYNIEIGIPGQKPARTAQKKIMFGAASSVKDESNKKKYASSADLEKYYNKLMAKSTATITAPITNKKVWSMALAEYILFSTGIRIGHGEIKDKNYDNGTKGLIDLVYGEDVKVFKSPALTALVFDFLGKDSVRNQSTLKVSAYVADTLVANWKNGDKLFNFTKLELQEDVKKIAKDVAFTPKLARTMVANHVMKEALAKAAKKLNANSTEAEKKLAFDEANMEVAKALNHQKGVSKQAEEKAAERFAMQKDKLADRSKKLAERKDKNKASLTKIDVMIEKTNKLLEKAKSADAKKVYKARIAKLNDRKAKMAEMIKKASTSLKDGEKKLEFAKTNRNLAAGTSKTAYIDPEFVKEWCDEVGLSIEKIYNKTQIKNFRLGA